MRAGRTGEALRTARSISGQLPEGIFNSVVEAFTPSREELRHPGLGAQSTNPLVRDVGCRQAGAPNSQPKGNTDSTLD